MDDQQKLLKKLNRRSRFTLFLAWLALFFTIVGIAAGYTNWLRIHDKAKAGLRGVEEIRLELPKLAQKSRVDILQKDISDNLIDSKTHLNKAMHELRNIQDSTQHIAETVYVQVEALTKQQEAVVKIQTPTVKDWSLGEVHFLLQTAVQRFNLKKDKKGAIEAFKMADTLLVEQGSLELLTVRKQISKDIATVNQFAVADVDFLSENIDKLLSRLKPTFSTVEKESESIELLPTEASSIVAQSSDGDKENEEKNSKESLVSRVKKSINAAVVIRKYEQPIQKEMDIEAKERLFQLISLRLETLRMMLLQSSNDNYHQQIKRIKTLTTSYYPDDEKLQKALNSLNEVDLSPDAPNVSLSLTLLEEAMSKINQSENSSEENLK
ncbi:MAG: uroporphyrinogen-III C-methyltransferase [Cocleimonas sp.]